MPFLWQEMHTQVVVPSVVASLNRPIVDLPPVEDYTPPAHLKAIPQSLAAAREVVYRHQSPLCQVPWKGRLQGLWVVVDLFSGTGGLLVALATLGVRFIAVCAEENDDAAYLVTMGFPDAIHLVKAEEFAAPMLAPLLERRKCQGVIVAGGAPCQPNSSSNKHSNGLADPRAQLYKMVINAAQGIRELPQAKGLQILELFENPVGRREVQAAHKATTLVERLSSSTQQSSAGYGVAVSSMAVDQMARSNHLRLNLPRNTFLTKLVWKQEKALCPH